MLNVSSKPAPQPSVPWSPGTAVVISVVAFFAAQALAAWLVGILFGALGLYPGQDWLDTTAGQFGFVLCSDAMLLLVLWLFLRYRHASWRQLGLGRRPAWRDVGYALLGFGAYFVCLIIVLSLASALTPINLNQHQELGFEHIASLGEKLMALVSLMVLPPIVEETVFRGFLYTGLRTKLNFVTATIVTSLLFASPHLLASSQGLLWVAGVDTLVLSFFLCYLREKTGALWACMAVHALKNGIAFVYFLSSVTAH